MSTPPDTMHAMTIQRHGGVDVLTYVEDFPRPRPAPGEALVRVQATGVNQIDRIVRLGYPGVQMPLPHIPGGDIAGVVAELGDGVAGPKVGTRVVAYPLVPDHTCALCLEGKPNLCQHWRYLGLHLPGGYAQYVCVPAENLLELPDSVSYEDAVVLPVAGLAAMHALTSVGQLEPGQSFFIWGGSGALGCMAIQIARQLGATVIATASGAAKLDAMRALGADHVIDRTVQDVPAEVRRVCPAGVDLALDYVGPATFSTTMGLLKKGGAMLLCGMITGRETTFSIHQAYMQHISVKGLYLGKKSEMATLLEWLAMGRVHAVLDSILPLAEARTAHEKLECGDHIGKMVLRVD